MQKDVWEKEYKKPKLVTGSDKPQTSVKDFLRWLRKERGIPIEGLRVLDLGCGNGKNANHIASLDNGNHVMGMDISETALGIAKEETGKLLASGEILPDQIAYIRQSIGEHFPFPNATFDLAFDVTSSNSLNEKERAVYLSETFRTLKTGGFFFVRALCKDADQNAKTLLKTNPGPEKDTYIMPGFGLTERVFSREDFIETYSGNTETNKNHFKILHLEKETHYSKFDGRLYKRNFWIAYLQKPPVQV
jgi:SAM-dependent methyltransferase